MKPGKFTAAVLALATFMPVFAQSFSTQWKKVNEAIKKDLPKTALAETRAIYRQAEAQGKTGDMLKAAITAVNIQADISADSTTYETHKTDSIAENEKRPTERALWFWVAGNLHSAFSGYRDKEEWKKALDCLAEAVKDMTVFKGHKANEYIPAIETGKDAKYYGNDMLNVVCRNITDILKSSNGPYSDEETKAVRRDIEHRFINQYRTDGNKDAVVLATLDSIEKENSDFFTGEYGDTLKTAYKSAMDLARQYASSTCAVEAYIYICSNMRDGECETEELRYRLAQKGASLYADNPRSAVLRNIIKRIKSENVQINLKKKLVYAGEKSKGFVSISNISNPKIRLYATPYTAFQTKDDPKLIRNFNTGKAPCTAIFQKSIATDGKDYFHDKDSFTYTAPAQPGIYLMNIASAKSPNYNRIVYVSNLRMMFFPLPGNRMRITVVDAKSGHPVPNAKVNEYDNRNKLKAVTSYTTDNKGETVISRKKYYYVYNAEYGNDKFMPFENNYGYNDFTPKNAKQTTEYNLYTDRGVYRPGQKVRIAGIVSTAKGDNRNVVYDKDIKLTLRDINNRVVATKETKSDEFGTFGAEIILPSTITPGDFRICTDNGSARYFKVEEYKRPTFEVKTENPKGKYAIGDTVEIYGSAIAYSGTPMQGARVVYEVTRRTFFRVKHNIDENETFRDTTTTDAKGNFKMRIPLTAKESPVMPYASYHFRINTTVTSAMGESQYANTGILAGKKAFIVDCNIPKATDKDKIKDITFTLRNVMGEDIEGKGTYYICKKNGSKCTEGSFDANKPVKIPELSNMASGKYIIHTIFAGETDSIYDIKKEFVLFSINDTHPADSTEYIRLYTPDTYFDKDGKAKIQLGTSLHGVTAFYDVISNGNLVESKHFDISNTLISRTFDYKEEYGDGISVSLAFMKDGKMYSQNIVISKPYPDKRLRYKWTSFRDRLRPNQTEEWRMQLLNPDGTPAKASAIAAIYDASLDKFAENIWQSPLHFSRYISRTRWTTSNEEIWLQYYNKNEKSEKEAELSFDKLCINSILRGHISGLPVMFSKSADLDKSAHDAGNNILALREVALQKETAIGETGITSNDTQESKAKIQSGKARENFAETAYFTPALRTDNEGNLTIAFTTPESLTRWNVKLLAHTKNMNYAEADTTATVIKDFMVQPNIPRFMRTGDRGNISATIRNLTNKPLSGKAVMTISDAQNLAIIQQEVARFYAGTKGETIVSFPIKIEEHQTSPLLICKITADCGEFSDGEQHYLPVFPNKTEVISAMPFTLQGKGNHTLEIPDTMFGKNNGITNKRLTIEYTSNPAWLAIQALPAIDNPKYDDAITLAASFYAASLEHEIALRSPEIKKNAERWAEEQSADTLFENALLRNPDLKNILIAEIPWATDADNISKRHRTFARKYNEVESGVKERNLCERLRRQQNEDGGFGWFAGMPSSPFITSETAVMLSRLNCMLKYGKPELSGLIKNAMKFLDLTMAKQIEEMKKDERKGSKPSLRNGHITYLDILRMNAKDISVQGAANRKYLLYLLQKDYNKLDMEDKSTAAIILNDAGYKKDAQTALKSVLEHMVTDKDMGMFFDSFRAPSYRLSYKIPVQVKALEAVRTLAPEDKDAQNGMLKWILQAKRTQDWPSVPNTVDAVYALLASAKTDSAVLDFNTVMPETITLNMQNGKTTDVMQSAKHADEEATGYIRSDINIGNTQSVPVSVNIKKDNSGLSWGGIYGRYLAPANMVESGGKELSVKREYLLVENGKEKAITANTAIGIGSQIRIRYTISASRDFDYVSLVDPRPACIEPVNQLSGYTYRNGEWLYTVVRDASQAYFFEKMEKGKHTVSFDFRTDRTGSYLASPATVQCLYSPEFTGRSGGMTLNVSK